MGVGVGVGVGEGVGVPPLKGGGSGYSVAEAVVTRARGDQGPHWSAALPPATVKTYRLPASSPVTVWVEDPDAAVQMTPL